MIRDQPVGQLLVEQGHVVEQQVLMIVHELFLNGPVEPFYMGIHFRGTGIGPPVRDAARLQPLLEVAQEFRAVVGEHDPRGAWQHLAQGLQRAGRLAAGRGGRGHGDREARVGIEKGEQVAAEARLEPDDGITGEHLEGRGGVAAGFPRFARPHDGFRLAPRRQADGGVPHLVGRTGRSGAQWWRHWAGRGRGPHTTGPAGRGVWPSRG